MHHKQFIQLADGPAQTAVARRLTLAQVDNQMAMIGKNRCTNISVKFSLEF
jgi:hypothetical protein